MTSYPQSILPSKFMRDEYFKKKSQIGDNPTLEAREIKFFLYVKRYRYS
jgi:hypothetical protein